MIESINGVPIQFYRKPDGRLMTRKVVSCERCGADFVRLNTPRFCSLMCRFMAKVSTGNGCWEWLSVLDTKGYGMFNVGGAKKRAHRISYELHVGPIPEGLVLDHLCRNRACVNPMHLEPVTPAENNRRGGIGIRTGRCRRGHEFTPGNTITDSRGKRRCRACANASNRASARRKREAGGPDA